MSKQRTRKFGTKILRKTCSSFVKIISDGEINFKQNKYNKFQKYVFFLQKISANMGSSTVQLQYVCKTKFTYLLKYKWYIISKSMLEENPRREIGPKINRKIINNKQDNKPRKPLDNKLKNLGNKPK